MTDTESTPTAKPVVYQIEAWRSTYLTGHYTAASHAMVWLLVGEIVADPDAEHFHHRDALVAWIAEQDEEPALGTYRVIQHGPYIGTFEEFSYYERRERDIERLERDRDAGRSLAEA